MLRCARVLQRLLIAVRSQRHFSSTAPAWRQVTRGLNLEGICTNTACEARNQLVICPVGMGETEIVSYHARCPMCHETIEATSCGFSSCTFAFEGLKQDGESCFGSRQHRHTLYMSAALLHPSLPSWLQARHSTR